MADDNRQQKYFLKIKITKLYLIFRKSYHVEVCSNCSVNIPTSRCHYNEVDIVVENRLRILGNSHFKNKKCTASVQGASRVTLII